MPISEARPPTSTLDQLRAHLRGGHLPGHFTAPSTMPILKNYLQPCRIVLSPVLLHEAHDALVHVADHLGHSLDDLRLHRDSLSDIEFHEALAVKVLEYADVLNTALPADAQLDPHIGNGVTLYLAGEGAGHGLIGVGMPHGYTDDEVSALTRAIGKRQVYVDGRVSACAMQPALNNLLLLMTHNHVNFGVLSNYTSTILVRRTQGGHPPLTPLVEVSRAVKMGDEPAPLLSHSPLGLVLGAVLLALKDRGVEYGQKDEREELLKMVYGEPTFGL